MCANAYCLIGTAQNTFKFSGYSQQMYAEQLLPFDSTHEDIQ